MAMPKHIAISLDDSLEWCRKNNIGIDEGCNKYFGMLNRLLELQAKSNIPVFTIYLLPDSTGKTDDYLIFSDCLAGFFSELSNNQLLLSNKIKISAFGKWYKLPGKSVEALKKIIEETREFDSFFANFCINYDGQEEIVDACKLIAKQVELGKIDSEMITKEIVRENLYSSYFLPPDVVLVYGERKLTGLLLWDSVKSNVIFADKSFMDFEEGDFEFLNHNLFK